VPYMKRRGDGRLVKIVVCFGLVLSFVSARQTVRTESVLVAHPKLGEDNGTRTVDSAGNKSRRLENRFAWLDLTGSTMTLSAWARNSSFATGVSQPFVSKADDVRIYSSALTAAEIATLAGTGVSSNQLWNQPPTVSLTAPTPDSTFTIPASIMVSATASDVDGTIAGVDFYAGSALLGTDTSSPYSVSWTEWEAASYPIVAVARDSGGASTVSSTRDIIVVPAGLPRTAVFTPATDHATAVDRYVLEVFPLGANTTVANPVATQDLGKPSITNGECHADITATVFALAPGTYIATITAAGSGGSNQGGPSLQFTR
jgi:hypothetical protein